VLADASIHLYHVRLSYVIKGFTYLLTYLDALCEHTMQQTTTRRGSATSPAGGAYSAPQIFYLVLEVASLR